MNDRRVAYDAQRRGVSFEEQERSMTLLGRRIEPAEIAPLAVFLASDDARMMTGHALNSTAASAWREKMLDLTRPGMEDGDAMSPLRPPDR